MIKNIISKIEKAGLVGRGGAEFPTYIKWMAVKNAKGTSKYVICNASEGELGLFKDIFILEKFPEEVVKGMIIAMDYLGSKEAFFNFNKFYYKRVKKKISPIINKYEKKGYKFTIFEESPSYIGGEETALLNAIEEKRLEPRLKPPYPSDAGLFGMPTIINNVETLYNIAKVAEGTYEKTRFYCITEKEKSRGVYQLPENWPIKRILEEIRLWPKYDFFVQIGGSASGLVINTKQMETQTMIGAGSIEIYPTTITPYEIFYKWFSFYREESCGKCTPCREGSYQLFELIKKSEKAIPWTKILNIVNAMEVSSFCALGRFIGVPVKSYMKNILNKKI